MHIPNSHHIPLFSSLCSAIACIFLASPAFASDKYVAASLDVSLTLPDQSVVSPTHTDIQAAIDDPTTTDGDTIWVQDGFVCNSGAHFYKPYNNPSRDPRVANRIIVNKKITLRSVSGTIDNPFMIVGAPDPDSNNGFGDNAIRCVRLCGDASLIGCIVTNGYTTTQSDGDFSGNGGGVIFDGPNNLVANSLLICNNGNYGGAVAASTLNPSGGTNNQIKNSVLTKNYCLNLGSAAYQYNGSVTLYDCQISDNLTSSVIRRTPLVRCVIANNNIDHASNERGSLINEADLTKCIVTNNSTINQPILANSFRYGCVIMDNYSKNTSTIQGGTFYNCTVYNNRSDSTYSAFTGASCYNTISWNNTSAPSSTEWYFSCAPEAGAFPSSITTDPMLVIDPVSKLPVFANATSPCIDTGNTPNSNVGTTDILGNPRVSGNACDMGATELNIDAVDILNITASPRMGTPSPAYGYHINNAPGDSFTCSMTDHDQIEFDQNPGFRYRCSGYSIFTNPNNPTLDPARSGTTTSFTYTHEGWANLQWNFEPSYVLISATANSTTLPNAGWVAYNSTLSLTAPEFEGLSFVKWVGDLQNITGSVTDSTISFTAISPRIIQAVYSFDSAPDNYTYVSASGTSHPLYGMGYSILQEAINDTPVGGTVWIEDGFVCDTGTSNYNSSKFRIAITKDITVRSISGSYEGGTTILGAPHSPASPLGNNAVRGVYLNNGGKLFGVTIQNGCTPKSDGLSGYGGGVQIQHADSFIKSCRVTGCNALAGGGIGFLVRDAKIYDTLIDNCATPGYASYGSALYGPGGSTDATFSNCTISNITYGIIAYGGKPTFKNCTFTKNSVNFSTRNDLESYNSIFTDNLPGFRVTTGNFYGNLFLNNDHPASGGTFYNCTFYGNTTRGTSGGTFHNCIAWNNGGTDSGTFKNSCYPNANGTNGNTNQNPNFILTPEGFPIPSRPSPCIDSANPDHASLLLPTDILGRIRIRGKSLDMGALETINPTTFLILR